MDDYGLELREFWINVRGKGFCQKLGGEWSSREQADRAFEIIRSSGSRPLYRIHVRLKDRQGKGA